MKPSVRLWTDEDAISRYKNMKQQSLMGMGVFQRAGDRWDYVLDGTWTNGKERCQQIRHHEGCD